MLKDYERQKQDLADESERNLRKAGDRFTSHQSNLEDHLKKQTIGLVSAEDFKKRREELEELKRREAAKTSELEREEDRRAAKKLQQEEKDRKRKKKGGGKPTLSFAMDGEDEEEESVAPAAKAAKNWSSSKRLQKNPGVDTSFLPDRAREEEERRTREQLRQEWLKKQEDIKQESIEITYSYWDGTGHRKTVQCKKGDSIAQFLEKCRAQFPELRTTSVDNMMYIKEDLIIPHHHTFYEFIINKSRGKSGPLFNFDVHDDVRMVSDATVEKDESHAGKVVDRAWYNRNKHIFPASRWELYETGKDYGSYSIHDRTKGK